MAISGMRLGEVYAPVKINKKAMYGIQIKHIQIYHKQIINNNKKLIIDNESKNINTFHAIKITIQNSKMRNTNQNAFVMMGRSGIKLDPALLLFDWYHALRLLAKKKSNKYKFSANAYLFQNINGSPISTAQFRLKFKKLVYYIGFMNAERLALPHSLRKGFASQLTRNGVEKGLIAFAGRWKLPESFYIYVSHVEQDMDKLAYFYFHAPNNVAAYEYDFDQLEYQYYIQKCEDFNRLGIDPDWTKIFNDDD